MHACTNLVALPIELHIAFAWTEALNSVAGRASGLVADEQHIMAWVARHGLEVVDDAATGAHAIAGDDDGDGDGGPGAAGQVVENLLVIGMAVDGDQLVECEWPSARLYAGLCFVVPVLFEFAVGLGEAAGQGGVEDDG